VVAHLNAILWHTHAYSHASLRNEAFHTGTQLVGHGPTLALLWCADTNTNADAIHAHLTTHASHHGVHHLGTHIHIAHFRRHHRIHAGLHHWRTAVGHHGSSASHNHSTEFWGKLSELILGHAREVLHPSISNTMNTKLQDISVKGSTHHDIGFQDSREVAELAPSVTVSLPTDLIESVIEPVADV